MKYVIIAIIVIVLVVGVIWAGARKSDSDASPSPSVSTTNQTTVPSLPNTSPRTSPSPISDPNTTYGNRPGNKAPDFQLTDVNGAKVSLKSHIGQQVALVFWNSICDACIAKVNSFSAPIVVFAINRSESKATVQSNAGKFTNPQTRILLDPTDTIYRLYGGTAMPYTVIIDANGIIQSI